MKQLILFIFFASICCSGAKAQNFVLGKYDKFHSKILNENRRILVYVPPHAGKDTIHYPVMYLLDGESHYTKTIGILDFLSKTAGNELCPKMIVVAIFHNDRERELVPPVADGGNPLFDPFAAFLEKELIPYVDANYPTTPFRVFAGHSLGGLRVVNTMVYQPRLFNSYIALDPSLGHVKNWIGRATEDFNKNTYANKSLYIAMGLTMPKGMDTSVIIQDTSGAARHMRSIMTFARNADQVKKEGFDFGWKYYPDESHQSVVFKGTYDGLVANFHWYQNQKLYDIFNTAVSAESSVKIITDYYEFLSGKMGYKILPPEQGTSELIDYLGYKRWHNKAMAFAQLNCQNYPNSRAAKAQLETVRWNSKTSLQSLYPQKTVKDICKLARKDATAKEPAYNISEDAINTFGYYLMQQNKLNEAELIFKLNIELYPNSYNVYDSYGECLLGLGREDEGISAYRKSLELNPKNSNAREVLEKHKTKQ